jgi:hypothetical protein
MPMPVPFDSCYANYRNADRTGGNAFLHERAFRSHQGRGFLAT